MPQPTHLDCAKLSKAIYSSELEEMVGDWKRVKCQLAHENQYDFQAAAYLHKNKDFVVIAFRGTKTPKNWHENIKLFTWGDFSEKLRELAYQFVKGIQNNSKGLNTQNLMVTGHSAGACLTEYCAIKFGLKGVAFESPSFDNKEPEHQNYLQNNVIHYFTRPNPVTTLYPHYGEMYSLPLLIKDLSYETGLNLYVLQQHSIANIVEAFQNHATPPHARKIKTWPTYGSQNVVDYTLNMWFKYFNNETAFLGAEIEYYDQDKRGSNHLQKANIKIEALIEYLIDNPNQSPSEDIYIKLACKLHEAGNFDRCINIARKSYALFIKDNIQIFSEQRAHKRVNDGFYFLIELRNVLQTIEHDNSSVTLTKLLSPEGFLQEFSNKLKTLHEQPIAIMTDIFIRCCNEINSIIQICLIKTKDKEGYISLCEQYQKLIIPDHLRILLHEKVFGFVEAIEDRHFSKFYYLLDLVNEGKQYDLRNKKQQSIFEVILIQDREVVLRTACDRSIVFKKLFDNIIVDSLAELLNKYTIDFSNNIFYLAMVKHPAKECLDYIFNFMSVSYNLSMVDVYTKCFYVALTNFAKKEYDTNYLEVVDVLIKKEPNFFYQYNNSNFLMIIVKNFSDVMGSTMLTRVIEAAGKFNQTLNKGHNLQNNTQLVNFINYPDKPNEDNSLHIAIKGKKWNMAIKLLETNFINASYKDKEGLTAIYRILKDEKEEFACNILEIAKSKNLDLGWKHTYGEYNFTVIHHAVYKLNKIFLKEALKMKSCLEALDIPDIHGNTPRQLALYHVNDVPKLWSTQCTLYGDSKGIFALNYQVSYWSQSYYGAYQEMANLLHFSNMKRGLEESFEPPAKNFKYET